MPKKKPVETKLATLLDIPSETYLSTGIPELDELLGGGFPRRRITQVWGQPGTGKSYLLARCLASLEGRALYIDAEYALNRERLEAIGVDMGKVDYVPNSQLEEVAEQIINSIENYDLVIIDTLAKLTPMTVVQNEVGTSAIGLAARQISHFEAKLRPKLYKSKAAVIGINQVRANFGMGMVQTQPFGGWAWGHSIDLNLKISKGANNAIFKQKDGVKVKTGHIVTVTVEKSRLTPPGLTATFPLYYKEQP